MRHLPIQIYGNNKLCFINKVREEHVQIIDLINTRGAQSVINPVNKIRGVYIYTADLPLFIDLFPASLRHPFSALTIISFLTCRGGGGWVIWVSGQNSELGAFHSDSWPNTHKLYSIYICYCFHGRQGYVERMEAATPSFLKVSILVRVHRVHYRK